MRANFQETGFFRKEDFKPDRQRYFDLSALGILRHFTIRRAAILVGYAVFMLTPGHLHFPALRWAMQDVLYVAPEHRGIAAVKFIIWQDDALKDDRIDVVYRHVSAKHDYSRTLIRLGYEKVEEAYARRI